MFYWSFTELRVKCALKPPDQTQVSILIITVTCLSINYDGWMETLIPSIASLYFFTILMIACRTQL